MTEAQRGPDDRSTPEGADPAVRQPDPPVGSWGVENPAAHCSDAPY